jgi:hypothetical protein
MHRRPLDRLLDPPPPVSDANQLTLRLAHA